MKFVGAHVSISGGVETAPGRAMEIGAKALGIFTKNQRQWKAPPLTDESISAFKENLAESEIPPELVVVHDTYLINVGNPEDEKRQQSLNALIDEVRRVEQLGLSLLNFHPGSGLKKITEDETLERIGDAMNTVIDETESGILVIEGTAGQGAHVGYTFEHLAKLIELTKDKKRVGVCLDTCHLFGAGFDLRAPDSYNKVIEDFNSIVGLKYLKAMHINDSKIELGSRKDRHEKIGEGLLGIETFRNVMQDARLDELPLILETPDPSVWKQEIETLYSLV